MMKGEDDCPVFQLRLSERRPIFNPRVGQRVKSVVLFYRPQPVESRRFQRGDLVTTLRPVSPARSLFKLRSQLTIDSFIEVIHH